MGDDKERAAVMLAIAITAGAGSFVVAAVVGHKAYKRYLAFLSRS